MGRAAGADRRTARGGDRRGLPRGPEGPCRGLVDSRTDRAGRGHAAGRDRQDRQGPAARRVRARLMAASKFTPVVRSSAELIPPEAPVTVKPATTRRKAAPGKAKAPARPKGRSKAEQRAESLEQMLDAAEDLFSKHGMYGVTLKDVAQKIGVHTSLMHYYFKDKQDLFEQVVKRRAPITIGRRVEAMTR